MKYQHKVVVVTICFSQNMEDEWRHTLYHKWDRSIEFLKQSAELNPEILRYGMYTGIKGIENTICKHEY